MRLRSKRGDPEPPNWSEWGDAAAWVVALRGPMGWLPNRLPAGVAWL